jgi:hypothetical protein
MRKFIDAGIVHAVKPDGQKINYWILTSVSRDNALKLLVKGQKIRDVEENLFSPDLVKKLEKSFAQELRELHENFGINGDCTAFLLRKILEKLLIIVFTSKGREEALEDKKSAGRWIGLEKMIDVASAEKIDGVPILMSKTAREIKGIKFLGDTAAHNPLVNVDMSTILPQLPYIIVAYNELAKRLR